MVSNIKDHVSSLSTYTAIQLPTASLSRFMLGENSEAMDFDYTALPPAPQ